MQQVLGTVSLPSNLPSLSTAGWLSVAEQRRVTTIARLLNQLPTESSAVITSADTLLTELFSHRGERLLMDLLFLVALTHAARAVYFGM